MKHEWEESEHLGIPSDDGSGLGPRFFECKKCGTFRYLCYSTGLGEVIPDPPLTHWEYSTPTEYTMREPNCELQAMKKALK
jgi:hypothetical protein